MLAGYKVAESIFQMTKIIVVINIHHQSSAEREVAVQVLVSAAAGSELWAPPIRGRQHSESSRAESLILINDGRAGPGWGWLGNIKIYLLICDASSHDKSLYHYLLEFNLHDKIKRFSR